MDIGNLLINIIMKKIALLPGLLVAFVCINSSCNDSSSGSSSSSDSANASTAGTDTSNSSSSARSDSGSAGSSSRSQANPVSLSKDDSTFVMKAADAGMTEVELGKIAQESASNDKVKEFGQMMVKDHSAANDQLKKIAQSKNIMIPDSLSSASKKHISEMQKKKGKDFDKAYMSMMVDGHQKVLKEFETEQSKGADAELKSFASQTATTIKGHLDSAKSIKSSLK